MNREVEFAITTFCQAKCPSCVRTLLIEQGKLEPYHISADVYKNVANNLVGVDLVSLCGEAGDPLMHPEIDVIIDCFLEKDIDVYVHTNAGLRDQSFFRKYAKKGVNFDFGIDGMDAETNNMYRIGVNFNKAWENMHAYFDELKLQKIKKGNWSYIIFSWNKHTIHDVYNYAKSNKIPVKFKINDRTSHGYVGKEEEIRLAEIINGFV